MKYIQEKNDADIETFDSVVDNNIVELQKRVKHYLKSFELENKFTSTEVASILGYSNMNYSRFKLVGVKNKIAYMFEFILDLAKLKNMSFSEFAIYIDNKPLKTSTDQLSRSLYPWEITLLSFMNNADSTLRRYFTRRVVNDAEKNTLLKERFEVGLTLSTLVAYLNTDDLKLIVSIAKELSNRANFDENTDEGSSAKIDEVKNLKLNIIKFMKDKLKNNKESASDLLN